MFPYDEIRITPAGAGKTYGKFGMNPNVRDHPRRCGENIIRLMRSVANAGSPPQVRGKQINVKDVIIEPGITPAGAGKT